MAVIRKPQPSVAIPEDLQERVLSEHDQLCELARKWLLRSHSARGMGCSLSLRETSSIYGGESPDALGFRSGGPWFGTYLVEVKTSRSDFLADRNKKFRLDPTLGVGNWRFYFCPAGLIEPHEVPEMWGLIWVNAQGHVKPQICPHIEPDRLTEERRAAVEEMRFEGNRDHELLLFISALRGRDDPQAIIDARRQQSNLIARLTRSLGDSREQYRKLESKLAERDQAMRRMAKELEEKTGVDVFASYGI
jgi:hypothetical protein